MRTFRLNYFLALASIKSAKIGRRIYDRNRDIQVYQRKIKRDQKPNQNKSYKHKRKHGKSIVLSKIQSKKCQISFTLIFERTSHSLLFKVHDIITNIGQWP